MKRFLIVLVAWLTLAQVCWAAMNTYYVAPTRTGGIIGRPGH